MLAGLGGSHITAQTDSGHPGASDKFRRQAMPPRRPRPRRRMPAAQAAPVVSTAMVEPSEPEQIVTLTNGDLIFHFTSHGGGLKTVSLRDYPAIISRTSETDLKTNLATLNDRAPVRSWPCWAQTRRATIISTYSKWRHRHRRKNAGQRFARGQGIRMIAAPIIFSPPKSAWKTRPPSAAIPAREVVVGTATAIGPAG